MLSFAEHSNQERSAQQRWPGSGAGAAARTGDRRVGLHNLPRPCRQVVVSGSGNLSLPVLSIISLNLSLLSLSPSHRASSSRPPISSHFSWIFFRYTRKNDIPYSDRPVRIQSLDSMSCGFNAARSRGVADGHHVPALGAASASFSRAVRVQLRSLARSATPTDWIRACGKVPSM